RPCRPAGRAPRRAASHDSRSSSLSPGAKGLELTANPVQSFATGGSSMNIFNAMAVKDAEEASRAITVIDVAPAFRGASGGLDAVAAQVRTASEQVGFFYI